MPLESLPPQEREGLVEFLTGVFQLPRTAPFVQPRLMQWKYDDSHPDWQGPRSYAWKDGGRIAAHACLCPVTYRAAGREVPASYLIDWAADRRSPGAGGLLLRKMASLFPVLLAIGGSEDTQKILPKLGYKVGGEISFFARVVRPWRQFRTDPFPRGWKALPRLARNTAWSRSPVPAPPARWTCTRLKDFHASHAALLAAERPHAATRRTPELMNYWLRCPGAAMSAFVVSEGAESRGWFVLSRVEGVLRIADLRVNSADPEHWRAAYALATRTALEDPDACELIAAASTPLAVEAIRRNGFRLRKSEPVFLLDPQGLLLPHAPLEIALIESDAAYLYSREYPYLT
jgi:hypothetical protein